MTIYWKLEANTLTSKYRFHKFWNSNSSFNITVVKGGSKKDQICISCAKGDRRIKVMPKWNQTDIKYKL